MPPMNDSTMPPNSTQRGSLLIMVTRHSPWRSLLRGGRAIADHVGALRRREGEGTRGQLGIALPVGEHDVGAVAERVLENHSARRVVGEADVGVFELRILGTRLQSQPLQP